MTWNKDLLFSSKRQTWGTPQPLFDAVAEEFGGFDLDAAASSANAKCDLYLTEDQDALTVSWAGHLESNGIDPGVASVWLNPPYGRGVGLWLEKVRAESALIQTIVCLVMVRSDTRWWQLHAMRADEIRLIAGRIHFQGGSHGAPAPSALLIYDARMQRPTIRNVVLPLK